MPPIEEWLRAHRRSVLAAIVTCSVLVRIAYFVELGRGPCMREHLWPQWDMEFFDRWARAIAAGDYLTARPLHPYHSWHADVATAYFRGHADDPLWAAATAAGSDEERDAVGRELWNRWYGGTRFHQEPLYPYAVALLYRLLGADVRFVFAAQMVLGVASNVLVLLLARRCFGELPGLVAGLLAVACSPALYYEMILLRTAPIGFLSLLIALVVSIALERGWRAWLGAGALIGLGFLLQSLLVLFLAGALLFLVHDRWGNLPRLLREGGALLLGVALALVPLVLRNVVVGAPPLSVTSVGAVTFICSNASDVRPDVGFVYSRFTAPVMADSGGRFLPAVAATLGTHDGIPSYARLLLGKLAALSHWYEIPNNTNFYLYRLHAPILFWLPVTFTIAFPLGVVGIALAIRERRRCRVLHLLVVASAAPMLLFYVLSRFRAALLLALLPFAAFALVRTGSWLVLRRFVPALASVLCLLLLLVWTSRSLPPDRPRIRVQDHSVTYKVHYHSLARAAEERGDFARAAVLLEDFLRLEPAEIRRLSSLDPPRSQPERAFARWYAGVHLRLAEALDRCGRPGDAHLERARAETLEAALRTRAAP